jgi:predicted DNA-binding transcriptional regulator AlpA
MFVDELLSVRDLSRRLSMCQSSVWARIRSGQLPGPTHRFGKRCSRWSWAVVQEWLRKAETNVER